MDRHDKELPALATMVAAAAIRDVLELKYKAVAKLPNLADADFFAVRKETNLGIS